MTIWQSPFCTSHLSCFTAFFLAFLPLPYPPILLLPPSSLSSIAKPRAYILVHRLSAFATSMPLLHLQVKLPPVITHLEEDGELPLTAISLARSSHTAAFHLVRKASFFNPCCCHSSPSLLLRPSSGSSLSLFLTSLSFSCPRLSLFINYFTLHLLASIPLPLLHTPTLL